MKDNFNLLSKLSFTRLFNLLKLFFSYYFSIITKKSFHKGMPYSMSIEPTTSCNLKCSQCPSGLKEFTRPTGKMSFDLFTKTIDRLYEKLIYLIIYFQGEPFLNDSFFDFVKYAKSKNIYTSTSTNAHFLDIENARRTVESGLDKIIISLDGADQKTYEKYRNGGNFTKVIEGIQNLISQKKELKSSTPYVVVQFIVFKHNEHQIEDIKILSKKLGVDKIEIKTAQIYNPSQNIELIPTIEKYSRYKNREGKFVIKKRQKNRCLKMWTSCVISWDGKVVPCCFDKDANYLLGDLQKEDFIEIWKNQNYNSLRNRILKSRKEIDICQNCSEGL